MKTKKTVESTVASDCELHCAFLGSKSELEHRIGMCTKDNKANPQNQIECVDRLAGRIKDHFVMGPNSGPKSWTESWTE